MRLIKKNNGPECLEKIDKYVELSNRENRDCKDLVISQLEFEQKNLCAYCNRKVNPKAFRIEHYIPQNGANGNSELALDYSNFLGVCHGRFNYDDHSQSVAFCESVRGSKKLLFNPQSIDHLNDVYYTNDGFIRSRNTDHDDEFENVLLLNIDPMRNARIAAYTKIEDVIFEELVSNNVPLRDGHRLTLNDLIGRSVEHQGYLVFKLQANASSFI